METIFGFWYCRNTFAIIESHLEITIYFILNFVSFINFFAINFRLFATEVKWNSSYFNFYVNIFCLNKLFLFLFYFQCYLLVQFLFIYIRKLFFSFQNLTQAASKRQKWATRELAVWKIYQLSIIMRAETSKQFNNMPVSLTERHWNNF